MRLKVDLNVVLTEFEGAGKLVWIYFKEKEFSTMRDVRKLRTVGSNCGQTAAARGRRLRAPILRGRRRLLSAALQARLASAELAAPRGAQHANCGTAP